MFYCLYWNFYEFFTLRVQVLWINFLNRQQSKEIKQKFCILKKSFRVLLLKVFEPMNNHLHKNFRKCIVTKIGWTMNKVAKLRFKFLNVLNFENVEKVVFDKLVVQNSFVFQNFENLGLIFNVCRFNSKLYQSFGKMLIKNKVWPSLPQFH